MVKIIQLLCPARHCIIAAAYTDDEERQTFEAGIPALMKLSGINPWCGICGSTDLHFEAGETQFETLAEAMPVLKGVEAAQIETARIISKLPKLN